MDKNDWSLERWRIAAILFFAFFCGLISGYWLLSLVLVLIGYIAWLLFKLNQLYTWFSSGAKPATLPNSNGIWEGITEEIQLMHRKSVRRKKRMSSVLKRSQDVITALPYATVVLKKNNEIEWANALSYDYLNVDVKTDKGKNLDKHLGLAAVSKILKGNVNSEIEVSLSTGDKGLEKQLAIQLIPIEGDFKLFIARDISERDLINKMRKNFIANSSHELRTPLTVIAGYLEIMQEDEHFPEHLQSALHSSVDQSIRMQRIIEDLLMLSRLENSELNDETSSIINMPSIVERVYADENTLIRNDSHTLKKDIDSAIKIKGSEAELMSVCSNLVHNAVRHTQDGTSISIEWKLKPTGEACLAIKDTGQGIPAEHIVHLTERFYRVDKGRSRDKGGTGLGLAIVQHIVQRHNGKLEIHSEIGKGSEFRVTFPVNRVVTDTH